MNRNERDRQQRRPEDQRGGGHDESTRGHLSEDDVDVQKEGNPGNERNRSEADRDERNRPGSDRRSDGDRENMER
jgi:hypothetical protein